MTRPWSIIAAVLVATCVCVAPAAAGQPAFAPLDQPGPPLSVAPALLQAALQCQPDVRGAKVEPVLLNPGTGTTAYENFSWNWEPALNKLGIPWCAYTPPGHTLGNIETSGEYLVYAIRTMYAMAGRQIAVMGHSQGGMSMRWALRFWPDTRPMVADVIGLAPSNHGTTVITPSECDLGCTPSLWQQAAGSNFIKALNSYAETFAGISYTNIYSHTDELVHPDSSPSHCSSCLHTGAGMITNVATQDVCPGDLYEHVGIGTVDPVAYALAVDALTHPGPADPARIPKSVCAQLLMPGVTDPSNVGTLLGNLEDATGSLGLLPGPLAAVTSGVPAVASEPPLACYVFAGGCAAGSSPPTHPPAGCPRATGRLAGKRLGLIRLGLTRAAVRRRYARSSTRGKRYQDFFCLSPTGVRVWYASPKLLARLSHAERARLRDRVVVALTSNSYYSLRGVRPGATIGTATRKLHPGKPFRVGLNWWYLAPNGASTGVLKVRHGVVEEIGIASRRLTRGRRAQRRFLTSFY